MSGRRDKAIQKNSKKLSHEHAVKEHLNAEKMLIGILKKQKELNKDFLDQIDVFIRHAKEQAKHSGNNKLELKYLEIIEEEESLKDKIKEHLKKAIN